MLDLKQLNYLIMKVFYTLLILLIPYLGFGQGWIKNYYETLNSRNEAFAIDEIDDGGFIVGGLTTSNGGKTNLYIFKIDSEGNKIWSKIIDGNYGLDETIYDLKIFEDKIYVAGAMEIPKNSNGATNDQTQMSFLRILDLDGELISTKKYINTSGVCNNECDYSYQACINNNCEDINNSYNPSSQYMPFFSSFKQIFIENCADDNSFQLNLFSGRNAYVNGLIETDLNGNIYNLFNTRYNANNISYNTIVKKVNQLNLSGDYDYKMYTYVGYKTPQDDNKDIIFWYTGSGYSQTLFCSQKNLSAQIQKIGGFNDEYAYDFCHSNYDSFNQLKTVIVGSTESYGNSAPSIPVAYLFQLNNIYSAELDWELTYGDGFEKAKLISNYGDNYIVLIERQDNESYVLIEVDNNGNIICESEIDMSNYNSIFDDSINLHNKNTQFNAIFETSDGHIMLVGRINSTKIDNFYEYIYNPFNFNDNSEIIVLKTKCGTSISNIEPIQPKKTSIKLINLLGQNISKIENSILFEIFDDGSVEKKVILE